MKRLTLLRHAKSSWSDSTQRDFDRPLNAKGKRAAARIGSHLAAENFRCDLLIASPARRVKETLVALELPDGIFADLRFDERLYLASATTLREVASETDDGVDHLMLMGHNSGLEDLVLDLVPDDGSSPLRDEVFEKYPTATVANMELDIDNWSAIKPGCGRLVGFVRPRDLDPSLGPEY